MNTQVSDTSLQNMLQQNWKSLVKPKGIEVVEVKGNRTLFKVEPLEKGYGAMLGNSLRRLLLSSIQGLAIIAVQIDGVDHEYSTIRGVREDVLNILLNLKQVVLKSDNIEDQRLHLSAEGPGVVKAGMIETDSSSIQIVNPEMVICHLDKGAKINMQLYITAGKGYIPADSEQRIAMMGLSNKDSIAAVASPAGLMYIDAIFSPIKKVTYHVENSRVGSSTDFDRLFLDVETNGSIEAEMALSIAAKILQDQTSNFVTAFGDIDSKSDIKNNTEPPFNWKLIIIPGVDFELTVRSNNCLRNYNVKYVGDLITKTEQELMKIPNLGKKSIQELKEWLDALGLSLGREIKEWPIANVQELRKKYEADIQKYVAEISSMRLAKISN